MTIKTLPYNPRGHTYYPEAHGQPETVEVFYPHPNNYDGVTFHTPWGSYQCAYCDTWAEFNYFEDCVESKTLCPMPNGTVTTYTVEFTSGKIIVTDDLRPQFDWRTDGEDHPDITASYNSVLGQQQVIQHMAAQGCAYGPVGNTSPGLYRIANDRYIIANYPQDDNDEEILPPGVTLLASICTDLWAYSIADLERYLERGGTVGDENNGFYDDVIDFPPGVYEFEHLTGVKGFDGHADTNVFATIRKVE